MVFGAPLEPLPWGRNVYTVVRMPAELSEAAREQGTRRVEGTINGRPVNLGLNRADVTAQAFAYAGKALQRRLGAQAGDVVDCRLRPADPEEVPVPGDIADALADAGSRAAFDRLRPAQRRRLLAAVDGAASAATRSSRIHDLVRGLAPH